MLNVPGTKMKIKPCCFRLFTPKNSFSATFDYNLMPNVKKKKKKKKKVNGCKKILLNRY